MNNFSSHKLFIGLLVAASLACNLLNTTGPNKSSDSPANHPGLPDSAPTQVSVTSTASPMITHLMQPAEIAPEPRKMIDDVESSGTGPEGRAPYGDSYKLNRFERPFLQDMTYVSDMDIHQFGMAEDENWYYVSILLVGNNPNSIHEINYGVEIDQNADGFGDYILWARPPYNGLWDTVNVRVFADTNQDSGGVVAGKPDADFGGDGYDTLIFDGEAINNTDPDLAWVRWFAAEQSLVQFAFKKSWVGSAFLLGVVSDAGLRDITQYDYNDYMTIAEAGSPVRDNENFPLRSLYAVDNTCWQAYGLPGTGFVPKACEPISQPTNTPAPDDDDSELACTEPATNYCALGWNPAICDCNSPPEP